MMITGVVETFALCLIIRLFTTSAFRVQKFLFNKKTSMCAGAKFDVKLEEKIVTIESNLSKEELQAMLEKSGKAVSYLRSK